MVGSALMALEKWLYDKVDHKEDVSEFVSLILLEFGLRGISWPLVSVGLYSPEVI